MTKILLPKLAAAVLVLGLAACAEMTTASPAFPMGAGSPDYSTAGPGVPSDVCRREPATCR